MRNVLHISKKYSRNPTEQDGKYSFGKHCMHLFIFQKNPQASSIRPLSTAFLGKKRPNYEVSENFLKTPQEHEIFG